MEAQPRRGTPATPLLATWVGTQRRAYAEEPERKAGRDPRYYNRITAARIEEAAAKIWFSVDRAVN